MPLQIERTIEPLLSILPTPCDMLCSFANTSGALASMIRHRCGGVRERRGSAASNDSRGLVDQRVVLKCGDHEQGVVHAARQIAGEDGIAHMLTPHRQALALAFFKIAAAYDRPPGIAGKNPPARFHLVINIAEVGEPP